MYQTSRKEITNPESLIKAIDVVVLLSMVNEIDVNKIEQAQSALNAVARTVEKYYQTLADSQTDILTLFKALGALRPAFFLETRFKKLGLNWELTIPQQEVEKRYLLTFKTLIDQKNDPIKLLGADRYEHDPETQVIALDQVIRACDEILLKLNKDLGAQEREEITALRAKLQEIIREKIPDPHQHHH